MKLRTFFFLALLIPWVVSASEEADFFNHFNKLPPYLEDLAEERYQAILWGYYQEPLELNTCSEEALATFHFLSKAQIKSFFQYIAVAGPLSATEELSKIPTWDQETIALLAPFVCVVPTKKTQKKKKTAQVQTQYLFYTAPIVHNPPKAPLSKLPLCSFIYRYKKKGRYEGSLFLHKGSGEEILHSYWGGHVMLKEKGAPYQFIVGDFYPQFGYGLTLNNSMYAPSTIGGTLTRKRLRLSPTQNKSRNKGMFGGGMIMKKGLFELLAFVSRTNRYATIYGKEGARYVKSLPGETSFCHKKALEKKGLHEKAGALVLTYQPSLLFKVGVSWLYTLYNIPFQKGNTDIGAAHHCCSFFADGKWGTSIWLGELACDQRRSVRFLAGSKWLIHPKTYLAWQLRLQSPQFHAIHGEAWGNGANRISQGFTCEGGYSLKGCKVSHTFTWKGTAVRNNFAMLHTLNYPFGFWTLSPQFSLKRGEKVGKKPMAICKIQAKYMRGGIKYVGTLYGGKRLAKEALCTLPYAGIATGHALIYTAHPIKLRGYIGLSRLDEGTVSLYQPAVRPPYTMTLGKRGCVIGAGITYDIKEGVRLSIQGSYHGKKRKDVWENGYSLKIVLLYKASD